MRAGGGSVTLDAAAGMADALVLTGTGQGAGTFTLNGGIPISFSGVTSFAFNAGDMNDTTTVSPFATSVLPWNVAVTIDGGTGTDRITYNNVAGLLDSTAVTATAPQAGHIDSPGVTSALNSQLVYVHERRGRHRQRQPWRGREADGEPARHRGGRHGQPAL